MHTSSNSKVDEQTSEYDANLSRDCCMLFNNLINQQVSRWRCQWVTAGAHEFLSNSEITPPTQSGHLITSPKVDLLHILGNIPPECKLTEEVSRGYHSDYFL